MAFTSGKKTFARKTYEALKGKSKKRSKGAWG
jgi:hypothetical protein